MRIHIPSFSAVTLILFFILLPVYTSQAQMRIAQTAITPSLPVLNDEFNQAGSLSNWKRLSYKLREWCR